MHWRERTFRASLPVSVFPSFHFLISPSPCFTGLADKIWVSASSGPCHGAAADAGGAHQGHHCHAEVRGTWGHRSPRSVAHDPSSPLCRARQGWFLAGPWGRRDLVLCSGAASGKAPWKAHMGGAYGPICSCKSNYMAQVLCCLVFSRTWGKQLFQQTHRPLGFSVCLK